MFEFINDHFSKIFDFLFWGVLVGYVVKRYIGDKLMKLFEDWSKKTDRTKAIWQHYMKRVEGDGHSHESVLDCTDGSCKVFRSYAS